MKIIKEKDDTEGRVASSLIRLNVKLFLERFLHQNKFIVAFKSRYRGLYTMICKKVSVRSLNWRFK